jgi:hypothetical protein
MEKVPEQPMQYSKPSLEAIQMIPTKKFVESEVHSEVESNSQNLNTFQIAH